MTFPKFNPGFFRPNFGASFSGHPARLFVSVFMLATLLLAVGTPISISSTAEAVGASSSSQPQPQGTSLPLPFPRLAAPYVLPYHYTNLGDSSDVFPGCCTPTGGPRSLDPLTKFGMVNVYKDDVQVENPSNPTNGKDLQDLRTKSPGLLILAYLDDREMSIYDDDYNKTGTGFANLKVNHPEYFLHDTSGNQIYFDDAQSFAMLNLTNNGLRDYLKARALKRLTNAPTLDGFHIDGNDDGIRLFIQGRGLSVNIDYPNPPASGDTNIGTIDQKWNANQNDFISYIGTLGRNHAGAPNGNNVNVTNALVLANASATWDYQNPAGSINGTLNTDSVNFTEIGNYTLPGVLFGFTDNDTTTQVTGYLKDVGNARSPAITTMTVDASNNWLTPGGNDPSGQANYRRLRYGLTTALMSDGFFQYNQDSFHPGVDPTNPWNYDEYDNTGQGRGYLGQAVGSLYPAVVSGGANKLQLLTDRDFERGNTATTNFKTTQWYNYASAPAAASFGLDTSVKHSGSASGHLSVTAVDTNPGAIYNIYNAGIAHIHNVALIKGNSYTVSFWLRSSEPRPVEFKVTDASGSTSYLDTGGVNAPGGINLQPNNWTQYTYSFTPNRSDPNAQVLINSGTVVGNLWVDDISISDNNNPAAVYERDFQNGTAIVNGTDAPVTVSLAQPYKHLTGRQDPTVNNGVTECNVVIGPYDGVIMTGTTQANPTGCGNGSNTYNLPLLANSSNTSVGNTTTFVTMQNLSSSPANVRVRYYGVSDGVKGSYDVLQIPPKGQQAILPTISAGGSFGGIISSDQPLNVVVSEALNAGGSAYNVAAAIATTLYSPLALNGQYGFTTSMIVFNPGGTAVSGSIQFYDQNGAAGGVTQNFTLPAHSSQTFKQPDEGLLSDRAYWAKIVGNGPLTAQVIEFGPANFVATFNALSQSQAVTKVFAPAVFNGAFGGYVTGMAIANTANAPASGNITYYNTNGSVAQVQPFSIPANGVVGVFQPNAGGPPAGFNGSATISSNQPLVVTVNERGAGAVSGTYVGLASGTGSLALPVMANGFAGFVTGTTILNVGSGAATVTLTYLKADGTPLGNPQSANVGPNASFQLYQGGADQGLPSGFFGTAVVTSSSPLMATTNAQSPNFFYTYTEPSS